MALKARKSGGVCWVRENGRLSKMQITVEDTDVAIIGVNNEEAIRGLIVQKKVRPYWSKLRRKCEQDWLFFKLPFEIQMMIIDNISTEDVLSLTKSCKLMDEFVNKDFVVKVTLPLSVENQNRLADRYVLDLTSTVDVKVWRDGEYLKMVKTMNLKKMKALKFNGPNIMFGRLSGGYLDSLAHYVGSSNHLQSVDILLDNSSKAVDVINTLSKITSLREVTLRNQSYPSNCSLLAKLLDKSLIVKLTLRGFSESWRSGEILVIKSRSLEHLTIEFTKAWQIGDIMAENLREIDVEERYLSECLYHSGSISTDGELNFPTMDKMGRLAPLLARGCPSLERFNELSIKELKKIRSDGDWLKELINHKGKGVGLKVSFGASKSYESCCWCHQFSSSS